MTKKTKTRKRITPRRCLKNKRKPNMNRITKYEIPRAVDSPEIKP